MFGSAKSQIQRQDLTLERFTEGEVGESTKSFQTTVQGCHPWKERGKVGLSVQDESPTVASFQGKVSQAGPLEGKRQLHSLNSLRKKGILVRPNIQNEKIQTEKYQQTEKAQDHRDCFDQLCANKFVNLDETDPF